MAQRGDLPLSVSQTCFVMKIPGELTKTASPNPSPALCLGNLDLQQTLPYGQTEGTVPSCQQHLCRQPQFTSLESAHHPLGWGGEL